MSMLQYNMIHSLTLLTLHENIDLDLDLDNCGDSHPSGQPRLQSGILSERSPSRPDHHLTSNGSIIYRSSPS